MNQQNRAVLPQALPVLPRELFTSSQQQQLYLHRMETLLRVKPPLQLQQV